MKGKIIITIDGWSSCGKSTLAKQMAKALGYVYIDSGAMYRAITLYFLRNHIDWTYEADVRKALENINLHFDYNEKSHQSEMILNDENVEYVIRDLVIAEKVSDIASNFFCKKICSSTATADGEKERNCNGWKGYWNNGFSRRCIKNIHDSRYCGKSRTEVQGNV